MQTHSPTPAASAGACTAQRPATFRLPLAACTHDRFGRIEGRSADGSYEINLLPAHGVERCNTQYWAYESRKDEHGRSWSCTQAQFAVDDFGNLVEVPA